MIYAVLYGALGFSGLMTVLLFLDLFGLGPIGFFVAFLAVTLFEGAGMAWAHELERARDGQRPVVYFGLAVSVTVSVFSSIAEIVMYSKIAAAFFSEDTLQLVTLIAIGIALASAIVCGILYFAFAPETMKKIRDLSAKAKIANIVYREQDKLIDSVTGDDTILAAHADQLRAELRAKAIHGIVEAIGTISQVEAKPTPIQNWPTVTAKSNAQYDANKIIGGGDSNHSNSTSQFAYDPSSDTPDIRTDLPPN